MDSTNPHRYTSQHIHCLFEIEDMMQVHYTTRDAALTEALTRQLLYSNTGVVTAQASRINQPIYGKTRGNVTGSLGTI